MSGIYIHIPFCKQACHYCDFHFSTSLKYKDKMLSAIQKELQVRAELLNRETIKTIYFGGGTPSLLSSIEIEKILTTVYQHYSVVSDPEITLEANPDDLTKSKIIEFSKTKINRLSIGVQSFFDDDLKMMNRAHNSHESLECLKLAKQYFDNITIDLIYGIPGLTKECWLKNLQYAFDLDIPHLSCYALTVEEKTALASFIKNQKVPPLDEELALDHFNLLVKATKENGYDHYEISNFGKPNYYSKHNTSYWKGVNYLGVGPSAHSFINGIRYWNVANNAKYTKAIESDTAHYELEKLTITDQFNEAIMIGLRTVFGVDLHRIKHQFGDDYYSYLIKRSQRFVQNNTLVIDNDILRTTEKGKFLADGIAADLFYV